MKKFFAYVSILVIVFFVAGCLTAEYKEYTWNIKSDGSGTGKIVWRNIFSSGNTEKDESAKDFVSLIDDYLEGTDAERDYPGFANVKKRLFIEDGELCGEMTFEFDELSDIGFYRYQDKGPLMFLLKGMDETFVECSGEWGGEEFTVAFFDMGKKKHTLKTSLSDPTDDGAVFFLDYYKNWKKDGSLPKVDEGESESPEENEAIPAEPKKK